jgi:glucosamine-6-phosphate deaminase
MSQIWVASDYQRMSEIAFEILVSRWEDIKLLGLCTGSSPIRLYELMIAACQNDLISFRDKFTVNLDEYVGLGPTDPKSYRYFMMHQLFLYVDVDIKNTFVPFGGTTDKKRLKEECEAMEKFIAEHGKVDLWILGMGENAHSGFCEPGTPEDSRTFVAELTLSTRAANARYFDGDIEKVPRQAITAGQATINEAKDILQLASGYKKEWAVTITVLGPVTIYAPATLHQKHPNHTLLVDKAAAAGILRYIRENKIPEIDGVYEVISEASIKHQVTIDQKSISLIEL